MNENDNTIRIIITCCYSIWFDNFQCSPVDVIGKRREWRKWTNVIICYTCIFEKYQTFSSGKYILHQ